MPVTFAIADHPAEKVETTHEYSKQPQTDAIQLTHTLSGTYRPEKYFQSSCNGSPGVVVLQHGLVHGTLMAYNQHHNLVFRPDDIWIAILAQFSTYITTNAEKLRAKFVAHEGKKDLIIVSEAITVEEMDFGELTVSMAALLDESVEDKSLIPWVLPNFSTTTANDTVICSAIIMASLREYFGYEFHTRCGIPFITLEGTQADWQSVLDRIEKLPEFGEEPTEWAGMLRAILRRFVRAFDAGGPRADKKFWERIIHEEVGSGTYFLSGWMSAFCAWDTKGVFFGSKKNQGKGHSFSIKPRPAWVHGLTFDGAWFPRVEKIPKGYVEVDVKVKDTAKDETTECVMLAGHVGVSLEGKEKLDTLRMAPHWFMFAKGKAYNSDTAENGLPKVRPHKRPHFKRHPKTTDSTEATGTEQKLV